MKRRREIFVEERFKNFTLLMSNINRSIRRIKTEEMAEFDLKSPHVSCLYYLYKEKALTPKQLCDICEEDKANVSRSVDYLKTNGFLRFKNSAHRYKSPLELTERGREVAAVIVERIDRIFSVIGEGLTEEQRQAMYEALHKISDNLQAVCERYKLCSAE